MLTPLPDGFAATRDRLHEVAIRDVSPARERVTGHIDLRATPGGFGTRPYGVDGRSVRVEGAELVREDGSREPIAGVDEAAARWLGAFYALAEDVLHELKLEWPPAWDVTPPKLWPEHFDYAIEAGVVRANYGFSPGDEQHPEPYVYVGPWEARPTGPLWNAVGFPGAELPLAELLEARDQRAAALSFMRERAAALHA
jgi:hypothetical protein